MKLLVFVCSCQKNHWKVEKQRVWLTNLLPPYLVFAGDPSQEEEYRYSPPFLSIRHPDYYERMPGKLIKAMRFVADWEFDCLLKVDDDVLLHTERINHLELNVDYAGVVREPTGVCRTWHHGKVHDPVLNKMPFGKVVRHQYCGGGIGYFLSRRAFEMFLGHADPAEADSWIFEDVYVGHVLGQSGIPATPVDMESLVIKDWVPAKQCPS